MKTEHRGKDTRPEHTLYPSYSLQSFSPGGGDQTRPPRRAPSFSFADIRIFGILERMIFRELVKVFLLCLVAITGILLMAGIVAEASQQGLNPAQILAIIPLLIPSTLPYTIPATTLFATCVVYGRLAADNEVLAVRASGISLIRVVVPGVLLGMVVSAGTMGLYYQIIPHTHHLMRSMFLADVEELLYAMLRKNGQISYPGADYSIFVQSVQGRRLIGPVFKHHDTQGDTDGAATAEEASLHVDMANQKIVVLMKRGVTWSRGEAHAYFGERPWTVDLPENIANKHYRRPRDLTWNEMYERLDELHEKIETLERNIEETEVLILIGIGRTDLPIHASNLRHKADQARRMVLDVRAEQHMRPALALGCLFFVLVGCPVGIWFGRSDYLSSFISCFLPIVVIYYPLLLCGTGMAKDGKFDTMLTVWIADAVVAVIGGFFTWRLFKS